TDSDADNLSIIMTALTLNRSLFVVARQNQRHNKVLFERVGAQVVMMPSSIIADRIRVRLGTPLLAELTTLARDREDDWACELVSRVVALVDDHPPHVWEVTIDETEAPALCAMDRCGNPVTVEQLSRDPRDREQVLPLIVLLRMDADARELLPAPEARLRSGDRLLLCGRADASRSLAWTLRNRNVLDYILTGNAAPGGLVWRWLARRRARAASET
ncbi:MAG: potassium transporter TrkA, partial [Gammaproteobacteria bacterium]|nr:potassium transporter TrkA [Gammaproteobacteria bacterium]